MALYGLVLILGLLALRVESSNLYAWGVNDYGQLGINGSNVFRVPQLISAYIDIDIVDLKASGTFHMAIASNGDVHVCGNNWYGGLGIPIDEIWVGTPRRNPDLKGCNIYLGKRHGNAVCGNRFLGWGVQSGYVIGRENGNYGRINQSASISGSDIVNITAGSHFSILTLTNGAMRIAGNGAGGVLGLGDTQPRKNFVEFNAFANIPLLKIFPSHADHICAVSQSHSLYCWGANNVGQLGLGHTLNQTSPQLVSYFEEEHYVVQVATGLYHTLVLTASGKVFAWGLGTHGVLGNKVSDNTTFSTPIEIEFLADKNVVEIVAGLNFNFVRTSQNQWYSWGAGYGGVLGTKTDEDVNAPTHVDFLATFQINRILTASTSRSLYGWLDPTAPTAIVGGPPLINECELDGVIECGTNERCQDTDRFAKCVCIPGYAGPIGNCVDIDECAIGSVCAPNATCTNLPGSYTCTCPPDRPIGDGKSSGTRCSPAPTEPPTQPPTEPPTEAPTEGPTDTPATTSSSSNDTTGATAVPTTGGATTDGGNGTTGDDSTTNQGNSTTGEVDTTTGSDTNPATSTTEGPSTSTGEASTNGRTNLYQTLYGAKEQISRPQSETEDDPQIVFTGGRKNRDRDVMIGVLIAFGVLMLVVIVIGALLILRARRPARD